MKKILGVIATLAFTVCSLFADIIVDGRTKIYGWTEIPMEITGDDDYVFIRKTEEFDKAMNKKFGYGWSSRRNYDYYTYDKHYSFSGYSVSDSVLEYFKEVFKCELKQTATTNYVSQETKAIKQGNKTVYKTYYHTSFQPELREYYNASKGGDFYSLRLPNPLAEINRTCPSLKKFAFDKKVAKVCVPKDFMMAVGDFLERAGYSGKYEFSQREATKVIYWRRLTDWKYFAVFVNALNEIYSFPPFFADENGSYVRSISDAERVYSKKTSETLFDYDSDGYKACTKINYDKILSLGTESGGIKSLQGDVEKFGYGIYILKQTPSFLKNNIIDEK